MVIECFKNYIFLQNKQESIKTQFQLLPVTSIKILKKTLMCFHSFLNNHIIP